jgi:hypothetical protein
MGKIRNAYNILVGKPEENNPLGRPKHKVEDNIRIDLREIGWNLWIGIMWLRIGASNGSL